MRAETELERSRELAELQRGRLDAAESVYAGSARAACAKPARWIRRWPASCRRPAIPSANAPASSTTSPATGRWPGEQLERIAEELTERRESLLEIDEVVGGCRAAGCAGAAARNAGDRAGRQPQHAGEAPMASSCAGWRKIASAPSMPPHPSANASPTCACASRPPRWLKPSTPRGSKKPRPTRRHCCRCSYAGSQGNLAAAGGRSPGPRDRRTRAGQSGGARRTEAAASERKNYLDVQTEDLLGAIEILEDAIRRIDRETREQLQETYNTRQSPFRQPVSGCCSAVVKRGW
jgi:chromosome segregation protein